MLDNVGYQFLSIPDAALRCPLYLLRTELVLFMCSQKEIHTIQYIAHVGKN